MRILKVGSDLNPKYPAVCPKCGTIFTHEWSDIKFNQISAWHEHHVICPTCSHELAWNKVPMLKYALKVQGTLITKFNNAAIVPYGIAAYALFRNGNTITLVPLNTLIPSDTPVLLVGYCNEIDILSRYRIDLTTEHKYPKAKIVQIDSSDYFSYLGFNENLDLIQNRNMEGYAIVPFDLKLTEREYKYYCVVDKGEQVGYIVDGQYFKVL